LEGGKVGVVTKVKPMGMLLMMLAGWINRDQQDVIVRNPCVAGSASAINLM